jgi:hypothetical protein
MHEDQYWHCSRGWGGGVGGWLWTSYQNIRSCCQRKWLLLSRIVDPVRFWTGSVLVSVKCTSQCCSKSVDKYIYTEDILPEVCKVPYWYCLYVVYWYCMALQQQVPYRYKCHLKNEHHKNKNKQVFKHK